MFRKIVFLFYLLLSVATVWRDTAIAQTGPIQSDCTIGFTFTASGSAPATGGYDNRQKGCVVWVIAYSNTVGGFSPVTITLQSAPNNNGAPGTWVTYAGQTVVLGSNPSNNTTATMAWITGYNPWVRVTAALTGSGTLTGTAYGWKDPGAVSPSVTITPSGTQNVNLIQVGGATIALGQATAAASIPVVLANNQPVVGQNIAEFSGVPICNLQAPISISASGNTQIIAASGSKITTICHISISTATPENVSITQGTGANCGSSTATLAGPYLGILALAFDFTTQTFNSSAGAAICVNQTNAQAASGLVTYGQN